MKKFSIILIFVMMFVLNTFANVSVQTQSLPESSSVAIENMSIEQLRERVKALENALVSYDSLKEENKRLRHQLRKIRTEMFDAQSSKDSKKVEKSVEEKETKSDVDDSEIKPPKRKEQTFWEWFTQ